MDARVKPAHDEWWPVTEHRYIPAPNRLLKLSTLTRPRA